MEIKVFFSHCPTWRLCRNYDIRGIVILNSIQNLVVSGSYKHMRSRNEFGMTIATQSLDRIMTTVGTEFPMNNPGLVFLLLAS